LSSIRTNDATAAGVWNGKDDTNGGRDEKEKEKEEDRMVSVIRPLI